MVSLFHLPSQSPNPHRFISSFDPLDLAVIGLAHSLVLRQHLHDRKDIVDQPLNHIAESVGLPHRLPFGLFTQLDGIDLNLKLVSLFPVRILDLSQVDTVRQVLVAESIFLALAAVHISALHDPACIKVRSVEHVHFDVNADTAVEW